MRDWAVDLVFVGNFFFERLITLPDVPYADPAMIKSPLSICPSGLLHCVQQSVSSAEPLSHFAVIRVFRHSGSSYYGFFLNAVFQPFQYPLSARTFIRALCGWFILRTFLWHVRPPRIFGWCCGWFFRCPVRRLVLISNPSLPVPPLGVSVRSPCSVHSRLHGCSA